MSAADVGLLALVITGATVMLLLVGDAFVPEDRKVVLAPVAGLGLLAAGIAALPPPFSGWAEPGQSRLYFNDTVAVDTFAIFFQLLFLGLGLLVLMLAPSYLDRRGIPRGEFYILLVAALTGVLRLV